MKRWLHYILPISGMLTVLLFCMGAAAGIPGSNALVDKAFSEPVNMILVGVGLIGFGSFIRRRFIR